MNLTVRPSTFDDYPALAEMLRVAGARYAVSAAELENMVRGVLEHPAKPHWFERMVEDDGQLVGSLTIWQNAGRFDPDRYEVEIVVHPDWQGRGIGRRLAELAREHLHTLQARQAVSGAYESHPRGLDFLRRQGFTEQFRYFDNVLHLRDWDAAKWPVPALPDGVRITTLAQLVAEQGEDTAWRNFHAAFSEAREDVPSEMPPSPTLYEVFRQRDQVPGYSAEMVFWPCRMRAKWWPSPN